MNHYLRLSRGRHLIYLIAQLWVKEPTIVSVSLNVPSPVIQTNWNEDINSVVKLINRPKMHDPSVHYRNL